MGKTDKDDPKAKRERWVKFGVKSWPVPTWYSDLRRRDDRRAAKREVEKTKRDPDYSPQPRKHARDDQYYW